MKELRAGQQVLLHLAKRRAVALLAAVRLPKDHIVALCAHARDCVCSHVAHAPHAHRRLRRGLATDAKPVQLRGEPAEGHGFQQVGADVRRVAGDCVVRAGRDQHGRRGVAAAAELQQHVHAGAPVAIQHAVKNEQVKEAGPVRGQQGVGLGVGLHAAPALLLQVTLQKQDELSAPMLIVLQNRNAHVSPPFMH